MGILKITASRDTSAKKIKQCLPELESATWVIGKTSLGHAILHTYTSDLEFDVLVTKMIDLWGQDLFDECEYDEWTGNEMQRFHLRRTGWIRWVLAFLELFLPLPLIDD